MQGARAAEQDVDVDLSALFASLLASWRRIVAVALAVTTVAFVLAWLATPHYKAETRILIETRESVFTRPESGGDNDRPLLDEEGVTSQVQVITSTDLLKQVATKLGLAKLPEFDEAGGVSIFDRALIIAGLKGDPVEIPPEERILKKFREKLAVYRVEKSRVIVIEFSSEDPRLAAAVPDAIADAYITVQQSAKQLSNTDATAWLKPEIADLSNQVKEAETKVAAFRSQSDLLIGQNNSVLATQQLSELSSELSRVRAGRGSAEAKAQSFRNALASGGSLDAIPEVMASGLIQKLRERQVQLNADIADLSTTLLDNHPRIKSMRSQLTDLDAQVRAEGEKVLRGLDAEAETARLRERELIADVNRLKAESARAGDEEVELRALEREAASQRELLESYLTRYREAASRSDRNYLPVDARIFSRASIPGEPYFPKIAPIVGAAFAGSLLLMAIFTLLRELFSGRAMRAASGQVGPIENVPMPRAVAAFDDTEDTAAIPTASAPPEKRLPDGHVSVAGAAERLIAGGASRAIVLSPEGDEGAATSVMLARDVADAGLRVLLLDLTASGAASRPMLDTTTLSGITNLLASEAQFAEVIHGDHYSDCHVIPVGTANQAKAMRAVDRLPIIISSLTTAYDVVVIECGPADAESIRRLAVDGSEIMISVIEPGDTAITETASRLREAGFEKVLLVTPLDEMPPVPTIPDRNAA
jgi:uncharacterized protein involved in exopolysaccharide biosynthesis/Mrp family chromosome partitioning ATPase